MLRSVERYRGWFRGSLVRRLTCQRAPLRVHAVEQLIGVPCSHCLQTAVHWSIDFALYCENIRVAQEFTAVDPVTSVSCEQAERTVSMATSKIRMIIVGVLSMRLGSHTR